MTGWLPSIEDLYMDRIYRHIIKRRKAGMEEASQPMVMNAIEIFKERYGIKEPLDLFRMDSIITELKEANKTKKKTKKVSK